MCLGGWFSAVDFHGRALTVPLLNTVHSLGTQNCLSSGVNCSYHLLGFFEEVTLSLGVRSLNPNYITYHCVTLNRFLSLPGL